MKVRVGVKNCFLFSYISFNSALLANIFNLFGWQNYCLCSFLGEQPLKIWDSDVLNLAGYVHHFYIFVIIHFVIVKRFASESIFLRRLFILICIIPIKLAYGEGTKG